MHKPCRHVSEDAQQHMKKACGYHVRDVIVLGVLPVRNCQIGDKKTYFFQFPAAAVKQKRGLRPYSISRGSNPSSCGSNSTFLCVMMTSASPCQREGHSKA